MQFICPVVHVHQGVAPGPRPGATPSRCRLDHARGELTCLVLAFVDPHIDRQKLAQQAGINVKDH